MNDGEEAKTASAHAQAAHTILGKHPACAEAAAIGRGETI